MSFICIMINPNKLCIYHIVKHEHIGTYLTFSQAWNDSPMIHKWDVNSMTLLNPWPDALSTLSLWLHQSADHTMTSTQVRLFVHLCGHYIKRKPWLICFIQKKWHLLFGNSFKTCLWVIWCKGSPPQSHGPSAYPMIHSGPSPACRSEWPSGKPALHRPYSSDNLQIERRE